MDVETFESLGIPFRPESAAHSYNRRAGTIRAFHYQSAPFAQAKLVSCVSGSIWDVAVDLRQDSSTFGRWSAVHLSEASGSFHLIPAGCAHGFLTLTDAATVSYLIEGPYRPEAARTLRWNDPEIRVPWPVEDPILSEKDRNAPFLNHPQPHAPNEFARTGRFKKTNFGRRGRRFIGRSVSRPCARNRGPRSMRSGETRSLLSAAIPSITRRTSSMQGNRPALRPCSTHPPPRPTGLVFGTQPLLARPREFRLD